MNFRKDFIFHLFFLEKTQFQVFLRKEWTKNLDWMQLLCKAEEMTYSFHTLSLLKLRNWKLFFLWTSFAHLQFFLKTILHACARVNFYIADGTLLHMLVHTHIMQRDMHARLYFTPSKKTPSSSREFVKEVCYFAMSTAYDSQDKHWGLDESY